MRIRGSWLRALGFAGVCAPCCLGIFLPAGGAPDSGYMIMVCTLSAYPAGYQGTRRGNLGHSTCVTE